MPVVIGNFEVMPAAAPAPAPPAATPAEDGTQQQEKAPVTPCAVAAAIRSLEAQALRTWAH